MANIHILTLRLYYLLNKSLIWISCVLIMFHYSNNIVLTELVDEKKRKREKHNIHQVGSLNLCR